MYNSSHIQNLASYNTMPLVWEIKFTEEGIIFIAS